jgi:hypothetical protein
MDWLTALVEIIKAAAWPGVIVFLGWYFKPQIVEVSGHMGEILPRLKRAWLLEFFEPILQRQRADDTPSAPEHPLTQLPAVSLPIQKVEEAIRRDLEKLPADQKQDALVRVLAQTQLAQFFENTYGLIFGTQISGLRRLAGSAVTIDEAKSFFQESVVARYPKYFREAMTCH